MAFYIIAGGLNNGPNKQYTTGEYLAFDAVSEQNLTLSQDATSFPVESGANISDNVSSKNDIFKMTGIISNSPMRELAGNSVSYSTKRTQAAIKLLRKLKESQTLLTLATEFEVLTNCVLTEVSYSQTAQTSEALPFVLTFERLRFASKKYVSLDVTLMEGDASKDGENTNAGGNNKQEKLTREQKAFADMPEGKVKDMLQAAMEKRGRTVDSELNQAGKKPKTPTP